MVCLSILDSLQLTDTHQGTKVRLSEGCLSSSDFPGLAGSYTNTLELISST